VGVPASTTLNALAALGVPTPALSSTNFRGRVSCYCLFESYDLDRIYKMIGNLTASQMLEEGVIKFNQAEKDAQAASLAHLNSMAREELGQWDRQRVVFEMLAGAEPPIIVEPLPKTKEPKVNKNRPSFDFRGYNHEYNGMFVHSSSPMNVASVINKSVKAQVKETKFAIVKKKKKSQSPASGSSGAGPFGETVVNPLHYKSVEQQSPQSKRELNESLRGEEIVDLINTSTDDKEEASGLTKEAGNENDISTNIALTPRPQDEKIEEQKKTEHEQQQEQENVSAQSQPPQNSVEEEESPDSFVPTR
jgi:hypothetical protein